MELWLPQPIGRVVAAPLQALPTSAGVEPKVLRSRRLGGAAASALITRPSRTPPDGIRPHELVETREAVKGRIRQDLACLAAGTTPTAARGKSMV
jgi:hypothetical protein